jgi:hypothetical protein
MSGFSHTFHYEDADDFMAQMDALLTKLRYTRMTPFADVRAQYPHLSDGSFYTRLNRFRGDYPREMSPTGKRTVKLFVTPELHAHLSK